ncbi:MAG: ApbE family protein [SAR86 cluster bacterium]|uniref:ApbE family protein n=1 Tax=SAR86 cluster bacterium TaxID=2030880 RepID=A0A2A5BBJ2_9GAMM|nr:MAG: ApbE family protein [SAR86 cluster bacterium]
MMQILFTFVAFAMVMLLMSVGVLIGRKPIQGSCGGMSAIDGLNECEICGGDSNKCEKSS